jgi:hypothetical protein
MRVTGTFVFAARVHRQTRFDAFHYLLLSIPMIYQRNPQDTHNRVSYGESASANSSTQETKP